MAEPSADWYAGTAHGLVWPHGFALVDPEVATAAADEVWRRAPRTLGDFVEVLCEVTGGSVLHPPGFAAAFGPGPTWSVAVTAGLRASVARTGEPFLLDHEGPRWSERQLEGVERIGLSLTADAVQPGALGRPVVAGVVPAVALLRAVASVQPEPNSVTEDPAPPPVPSADPETPPSSAIPGTFSHLWGDTILGPASAPAPKPTAPQSAAAPPAPAPEQLGDHDGQTVLGPAPTAPIQAPPAAGPSGGLVLVRHCARTHPNPPDRSVCRTCGDPLTDPPTQIPQPSLGRAVLASGQIIDLTGPVVFGREPTAKRITSSPLPQLVPLPAGHISGNHLRLLVEGWQVLAVDLHSKNGTLLRRPGEPPLRLPERPLPLRSADVLDFGHGVLLTLEDLP